MRSDPDRRRDPWRVDGARGADLTDERAAHVTEAIQPALRALASSLAECVWQKADIAAAMKKVLSEQGLKMPQLAMPVRVLVMGTAHTPSIDAVLELLGQKNVIQRLQSL